MKNLWFISLLYTLTALSNEGPGNQYVGISLGQVESNLAIVFKNSPKWHTYWKNPGDAGLTIKPIFSEAGKELKLAEKEWPAPHKYIEDGDILTYGYEGQYGLFFDLPKKDLKAAKVQITFLVCKDICIQGRKELNFSYIAGKLQTQNLTNLAEAELKKMSEDLPQLVNKPKNLELYLNKGEKENTLLLHYEIKNVANYDGKQAVLFPFINPPFGQKKEQLHYDAKNKILYGSLPIDWEGEYLEPALDLPKNGKFKAPLKARYLVHIPGEKPFTLDHQFTSFSLSDPKTLKGFFLSISEPKTTTAAPTSLLTYIFLALIGGMILNLMPCVLPVISIKLFGMIKHAHLPQKEILKQNAFYTLGILTTLWSMATAIIFLQKSGEVVGWGFQLQSPLFVFFMILFLFIFALNLFGLFEFITPGGKTLGGKHGGPFVSGIISVILSTPCSAPFLGTALGFAFTTGPAVIFLIFTSIGIGLASPFIITGLVPGSIKFLPRPGIWMEKLKYFLGLALLLTAIWLTDVFLGLINPQTGALVLILQSTFIFFALFAVKKIATSAWLKIFFLAWPVILFSYYVIEKNTYFAPQSKQNSNSSTSLWHPWSEEKLQELKGKSIFIDFTADWCLTCKVNKKLVLDTESFQQFTREKNLVLLRADWTNRDDQIGNWLAKFQVVGIPAYFVQHPDGEIKYLGETVSIEEIKKALD